MRKYCSLKGKDPFTIIPETFHISKSIDDPEYKKFLVRFEAYEEEKKDDKNLRNLWIVKPG